MGIGAVFGGVVDGYETGKNIQDKERRTDLLEEESARRDRRLAMSEDKYAELQAEKSAERGYYAGLAKSYNDSGTNVTLTYDGGDVSSKEGGVGEAPPPAAALGGPPAPAKPTAEAPAPKETQVASATPTTMNDGASFSDAAGEADANLGTPPPNDPAAPAPPVSPSYKITTVNQKPVNPKTGNTDEPVGSPPLGFARDRMLRLSEKAATGDPVAVRQFRVAHRHYQAELKRHDEHLNQAQQRRLRETNIQGNKIINEGNKISNVGKQIATDAASLTLTKQRAQVAAQRTIGFLSSFEGFAPITSLGESVLVSNKAGAVMDSLKKNYNVLFPDSTVNVKTKKGANGRPAGYTVDVIGPDGEPIFEGRQINTVHDLRQAATVAYGASGKAEVLLANHQLTGAIGKMSQKLVDANLAGTESKIAASELATDTARAGQQRLDAATDADIAANELSAANSRMGLTTLPSQAASTIAANEAAASKSKNEKAGSDTALKLGTSTKLAKAADRSAAAGLEANLPEQGVVEAKTKSEAATQANLTAAQASADTRRQLELTRQLQTDANAWYKNFKGTTEDTTAAVKLLMKTQQLTHPDLVREREVPYIDPTTGLPHKDDSGKITMVKSKTNVLAELIKSRLPSMTGVISKGGKLVNQSIEVLAGEVAQTRLPEIIVKGKEKGLKGAELEAYVASQLTPYHSTFQFQWPVQKDYFEKSVLRHVNQISGAIDQGQAKKRLEEAHGAARKEEIREYKNESPEDEARRAKLPINSGSFAPRKEY